MKMFWEKLSSVGVSAGILPPWPALVLTHTQMSGRSSWGVRCSTAHGLQGGVSYQSWLASEGVKPCSYFCKK